MNRLNRMNREHRMHILCVHGSCHGAWCFESPFRKVFEEEGFPFHAPDLPGHGEDRRGLLENVTTFQFLGVGAYARALRDEVDKLFLPRPEENLVLVAHSMGGHVVSEYLRTRRAAAVVFLAPVPPAGTCASIRRAWKNPVIRPWLLEAFLTGNFYALVRTPKRAHTIFWPHLSEEEGRTYHRLLGRESLATFLQGWFLRRPNPDLWRDGGPARRLVIGGGRDAIFEWQEMVTMADRTGAERHLFPDMGHDLMLGAGAREASEHIVEWVLKR
jgi:pimeloyl-ACP methyl ester carboxylesterase